MTYAESPGVDVIKRRQQSPELDSTLAGQGSFHDTGTNWKMSRSDWGIDWAFNWFFWEKKHDLNVMTTDDPASGFSNLSKIMSLWVR